MDIHPEFCIRGYRHGNRRRRTCALAKVKNGFVPRVRDEIFPALKALQTAKCLFKNLPEIRASRWGESLTAVGLHSFGRLTPNFLTLSSFAFIAGAVPSQQLETPV
jgi:hypothetical protein